MLLCPYPDMWICLKIGCRNPIILSSFSSSLYYIKIIKIIKVYFLLGWHTPRFQHQNLSQACRSRRSRSCDRSFHCKPIAWSVRHPKQRKFKAVHLNLMRHSATSSNTSQDDVIVVLAILDHFCTAGLSHLLLQNCLGIS